MKKFIVFIEMPNACETLEMKYQIQCESAAEAELSARGIMNMFRQVKPEISTLEILSFDDHYPIMRNDFTIAWEMKLPSIALLSEYPLPLEHRG